MKEQQIIRQRSQGTSVVPVDGKEEDRRTYFPCPDGRVALKIWLKATMSGVGHRAMIRAHLRMTNLFRRGYTCWALVEKANEVTMGISVNEEVRAES